MEIPESSERDTSHDEVVAFLKDAYKAGFLNRELAETLYRYRMEQLAHPEPRPEPAPVVPKAAAPEPRAHPAFQPSTRPTAATSSPAAMAAPPSPQQAVPEVAPPAPSSPPVRVPRPRRTRAEVWARFAKMRSKKLWGTFTADFAAHALTYLGVLLSLVVIYVFFAFGYFGEVIDEHHKQFRPLVEIGVILFFLGLAWLLRHRSGIPQTSTAIELIGIILVPIMLSASFRDGCTPSYRPWCVPPDLEGPGRWAAYAGAGLISAAIYYVFARRRAIYAYLVGVATWVSLGALALYLEDGLPLLRNGEALHLDRFTSDGISAPQLITVLAGIGVSIGIAARARTTKVGRLLSVPTVRAGVFFTPFVLALSLVFSYNDALSRGVINPNLTDLAWPNVIATAIAAGVFATASNARFAWEDLGPRMRRDTALVLQVAAYLSLAASWLLTAGFGVPPAWLGAGLVGYAAVIALFDRYLTGPRIAVVWIARTALAVGAALSLLAPGATIAAWGSLAALAVLRSGSQVVADQVNRFVPEPERADLHLAAMWAPALVAVGAGAARIAWPEAAPLVLLGAGGIFVASRWLPARFAELRSFASLPAVLTGIGALCVEIWRQSESMGFAPYALSGFLLALAALAGFATIPTPARAGAAIGLAGAAAMVALREYFGSGAWETAWIDTAVLATAGVVLVAASLIRSRDQLFFGLLGHALVLAAAARSLWFEETAILGLGVLAAVHIAEAVNIEMGRDGLFPRLARSSGSGGEAVLSLPTLVAAVTLAPLTILIGRQVPFVADERARFGPVLGLLSWFYLAGAMQRGERARRIAVPFAYVSCLVAVAVSAPSIMASLLTALSAAVLTALLAIRARRPYTTVLSWVLAVGAGLLAAYRFGVAGADLYRVIHLIAALLVVVPALLSQRPSPQSETQPGGLASPWLVPPLYLGMLLLPASLAMAIADGGWIAWIAVSTAVDYAVIGLATRAGGVAIPVAAATSIAYASVLYDNQWAHPFDQPLVWLPLAAAFVGLAAVLPGNRRWRFLEDPAPGLVIAALGVAGLATAYSYSADVLDLTLVGCAGLLVAIYFIRAEEPWLIFSGLTLVAAGLVAGDYWAPAATLTAALVTGYFADRKREDVVAAPLRAVTIAGVAATLGLTGMWLNWSASQLAVVAGVGAAAVVTAAVVFAIAMSWPRRISVWTGPLHVLGHGLVATSYLAALVDLSGAVPYGVATLLALLESGALGVIGTVRRRPLEVGGSVAFFAAAYALFTGWQQWDTAEIITYTAIMGAGLSALAVAGFISGRVPDRLRLWLVPVLIAGQGAGATVVAIAASSLDPSPAAGIAAGVFGFEAVLVGTAGAIVRDQRLVAGAAIFAAVSYGSVPQWLGWTRMEFIATTAVLGAVLAAGATVLTRLGRGRLWALPLHGLAVLAVLAVAAKTLGAPVESAELWVLSGVAFGCGGYAAANAATAPGWRLPLVAVVSFLGAGALAIGAEAVRDGAVFAIMLLEANVGVVLAVTAGLLAGTDRTWRSELALLAGGLPIVTVVAAAAWFDPLGVEMGTLLVVAGAALAAYGLLAHDLVAVEAAMVVWLGALMILVNEQMELTLHAAVVIASVTLLATVELERHRRQFAEQPVPAGLHHLEWVLMLAPLVLAVADMFQSLWFGLALFAEGALLLGWGALSEVRRRALLGSGAMVAAIVLSVIIPALHGLSEGLTGGTWLAVGAVAATVFILAGSTIERRRQAIGRRLAHIAEILEHWE